VTTAPAEREHRGRRTTLSGMLGAGPDTPTIVDRVGRNRWLRMAARIAIVVITVLALAGPAQHAVSAFRAPVHDWPWSAAEMYNRQFSCIARDIAAQVPRGADVYISPDQQVEPSLWYQRLSEMTYPYARQVGNRADAQVEVAIELVPPDVGCSGVRLVVTTLR
jgi:hypothetical protein